MSVSTIAAEQLALQGARCGKAARRDLTRGWPRKGSVYSTAALHAREAGKNITLRNEHDKCCSAKSIAGVMAGYAVRIHPHNRPDEDQNCGPLQLCLTCRLRDSISQAKDGESLLL